MSAVQPFALLQFADPNAPPVSGGVFYIATILKLLVIFTIYMVGVAMLTLAERKISAWIQDRRACPLSRGSPDAIAHVGW